MKQQRPIYIKHPDLTKMQDDQLTNEANYLLNYGKEICQNISSGFDSRSFVAKPPLWKIIDDLQLAYDRYQAVCEEIQYRAIQMR